MKKKENPDILPYKQRIEIEFYSGFVVIDRALGITKPTGAGNPFRQNLTDSNNSQEWFLFLGVFTLHCFSKQG